MLSAFYYDLVGNETGQLEYIEVQVETELPGDAFLFARQPLNQMLDAIARLQLPLPLVLGRLELFSPIDGGILAYELIIPYSNGLKLGPLGGIQQFAFFAQYDSIFREAIASTSPFYSFLCACRVYEGTNWIRRLVKNYCNKLGIKDRLPGDPEVDAKELIRLGFDPGFCKDIHRAADLFEKLKVYRNGIAHFLIEEEQEAHIHLASGERIRQYSIGSILRAGGVHIKSESQSGNPKIGEAPPMSLWQEVPHVLGLGCLLIWSAHLRGSASGCPGCRLSGGG